ACNARTRTTPRHAEALAGEGAAHLGESARQRGSRVRRRRAGAPRRLLGPEALLREAGRSLGGEGRERSVGPAGGQERQGRARRQGRDLRRRRLRGQDTRRAVRTGAATRDRRPFEDEQGGAGEGDRAQAVGAALGGVSTRGRAAVAALALQASVGVEVAYRPLRLAELVVQSRRVEVGVGRSGLEREAAFVALERRLALAE